MAPICGVCTQADSKYKCPTCELRYCSIICYKAHKPVHDNEKPPPEQIQAQIQTQVQQPKKDRPGTKQRGPKLDFTGFEDDPELQRILTRYPALRLQLQAIYGLTLDPGPDAARSWNRQPLPTLERANPYAQRGGRGRGRGRGRGGFGRGGRGGRGGFNEVPEEREHGSWTKEKGDKEALHVIKDMRDYSEEDERAEGLREFVELVRLRFGEGRGSDAGDEVASLSL